MDPATIAALTSAAIQAAGSIGGGMLGSRGQGETKIQRKQRHLIDQLLASLTGQGPFSHLFATDEAAFQKSFVDPAKAMFKNQIAPGIQQEFISSGMQRGSGLDDSLQRAGVDLDQILNQNYMQFQGQGQDRMSNILNAILGMGSGAAPQMSTGQAFGQSAGGYLSSDAFSKSVGDIFKPKTQNQFAQSAPLQRRGFEG